MQENETPSAFDLTNDFDSSVLKNESEPSPPQAFRPDAKPAAKSFRMSGRVVADASVLVRALIESGLPKALRRRTRRAMASSIRRKLSLGDAFQRSMAAQYGGSYGRSCGGT